MHNQAKLLKIALGFLTTWYEHLTTTFCYFEEIKCFYFLLMLITKPMWL